MPSSGSSNFDFDLFHFLGFTNELRIFSAFLHSSEPDGSFISLNRQPYEVGRLLHSGEDIGLLNCFCMVSLAPPEVFSAIFGILAGGRRFSLHGDWLFPLMGLAWEA